MGGSMRPPRMDKVAFKLLLPREQGKRRYRLEVGVTNVGVTVAASGDVVIVP